MYSNVDVIALMKAEGFLHSQAAEISSVVPHTHRKADGILCGYTYIVMGALPYSTRKAAIESNGGTGSSEPETSADMTGTIAPFGWRNYYREAIVKLKRVARSIRNNTNREKQDIRLFSNSELPEKELAARLGVGFIGKNSLLITESAGSRCVLAGMLIAGEGPLFGSLPGPGPLPEGCGSCTACIENCPVSAITSPGRVDRALCLQSLASRAVELETRTMEVWGRMIYGCEYCQEVCPYNGTGTLAPHGPGHEIGAIGPEIDLRLFLTLGPDKIKPMFKKSVLDMSWIDPIALQRNAIIAAGNGKNRRLRPLIKKFESHAHPALRKAAEWALTRCV